MTRPEVEQPPVVPEGMPRFLSAGDVAEVLGMTYEAVKYARKRGRLVGRQPEDERLANYRFFPKDVAAFAEAERITPRWEVLLAR